MGSTSSNQQKFINFFFNYFLEKTDIYNMVKIVRVIDFISLGPDYNKNGYIVHDKYINLIANMYNIDDSRNNEYKMVNINSSSSIGKKTINTISIIRDLMIKEKEKIFNNINAIDVFNTNFNKNENFEEINKLTKLLEIENSKINDIELENISDISKNISNLNNKLYFLKNNIIEFDNKIKKRKLLKINLINISLFLESTNHLFLNESLNKNIGTIDIPHATILPDSEKLYSL